MVYIKTSKPKPWISCPTMISGSMLPNLAQNIFNIALSPATCIHTYIHRYHHHLASWLLLLYVNPWWVIYNLNHKPVAIRIIRIIKDIKVTKVYQQGDLNEWMREVVTKAKWSFMFLRERVALRSNGHAASLGLDAKVKWVIFFGSLVAPSMLIPLWIMPDTTPTVIWWCTSSFQSDQAWLYVCCVYKYR